MNKELDVINRCIPLIGKTPDIVDGYLEGDIIELLTLLAKYKYKHEFEYTCKSISETNCATFREINNYMLTKITNEQYLCSIFDDWYIDILTKYK